MDYVDPPNDVKTRWWITYLMFEALLQLRESLSKMNLPTGCPRLSELNWWVLQVGEEVLRLSGSVCVWMCRVLCISLV